MTPLEEAERKSRLWHIHEACTQLLEYTSSRTVTEYRGDRTIRLAVERLFTIIGEAMSRLRVVDPAAAERITAAAQIVGLRNQLIHNYPAIGDDVIWAIARNDLPLLLAEVQALLAE